MIEPGKDPKPGGAPQPDLTEIFDLNRKKLTRRMVDRFEETLRAADAARDDIREVAAECDQEGFTKKQIAAMKKIAKLRKDDKVGHAQAQLRALEEVSNACAMNLFGWAGSNG